jgi:hypothetical protein
LDADVGPFCAPITSRTHLAYKAEHVVDLATELILAAKVYPADEPDSAHLLPSLVAAQVHLMEAESGLPLEALARQPQASIAALTAIEEAATDKGYHKVETLAAAQSAGVRTYTPEKRARRHRVWTDKPAAWERAYRNNRRRVAGRRGKRLGKLRSEKVERSFAHVCVTGGGRRSWLRGLAAVGTSYLMRVAGHNLGIIMRWVFGRGTPRSLQGLRAALWAWWCSWRRSQLRVQPPWLGSW